jgi:choice-of-anchor A domain-containing protein
MKPAICRSALFALVLGAGSAAAATPLTAEQTLNQFNLIVFGNATSYSHVDGRSYIGGTVTGGDYAQHPGDMPASAYAGLTVGGNASLLHVNSNGAVIGGNLTDSTINSGSAVVFGNATGVNFNGLAYVAGSSSANFNGGIESALATGSAANAAGSTNFAKTLAGLSAQLSHLTNGSGSYVALNGNKATFNAVADANGLAVFNPTDSVLNAGEFEFNLGSATTIVINSGATSADIGANFLGGGAQKIGAKTLWNFYNATSLSVGQFGGSILAPLASFTNYNNVEGGVFVDSLSQRGEIHLQPFVGQLHPVPEPETWAMLLGGLAMLGVIARRRLRA